MKVLALMLLAAVLAGAAAAQERKGTITGRVVDERGKGVARARVSAEASGGAAVDATADGKGAFRIELDPGSYRLTITADGYAEFSIPGTITVEAGKRTKLDGDVEMKDLEQGSVVRGSVFSEEGRSLAGAKVVLEREDPADGKFKREARTDQTGLFAFTVPKGTGRYRVTASREGFTPASRTVEVSGGEITNIAIKLAAGADRPR